jgi:aryl-alcohol dehydrogenase-like predicted oxidoreductase
MEYTKLGRTGLDVSRFCLGCMSYGGGNSGHHQWSLGEEESRPFIKRAPEAGINFFDTANRYSIGKSEEILGRAIRDFARLRRGRHRNQGLQPHAAAPERRRAVAQGDHVRDRREPAPAWHGLRRSSTRVAQAAAALGVSRAQIALAWLLTKPVITAPIVGASKLHHLDDALASLDVKLSADEIAALEGTLCAARGRRLRLRITDASEQRSTKR